MSDTQDPFEFRAFGFVLPTKQLKDSVEFYHEKLELPIWFRNENKVCLRLGAAYLMLDASGTSSDCPPVLQFSVADVMIAAGQLSMRGVRVELSSDDRGQRALFRDPDGNICELVVEDPGFETIAAPAKNPMPAPLRPRS